MSEDRKDLNLKNDQTDHGTQGGADKVYLFDKPRNVKIVIRGLVVLCIILVILDLIIHRHAVHPWEHIFAFYPIYGFVSCVVLVLLAKELRKLVMRSENYYDPYPDIDPFDDDGHQEHHDA
jgi:hypothetical protein